MPDFSKSFRKVIATCRSAAVMGSWCGCRRAATKTYRQTSLSQVEMVSRPTSYIPTCVFSSFMKPHKRS